MFQVRQEKRFYEEIQIVQNLLQGNGESGINPGSQKIVLVIS